MAQVQAKQQPKIQGYVKIGRERFPLVDPIVLGRVARQIGAQCLECGNALDAEEPAVFVARGCLAIECPSCAHFYPIRGLD